MNETARRLLRLAAVPVGFAALGLAVWLGYAWRETQPVERIQVVGAAHAAPAELLDVARLEPGLVLYHLDPAVVADRLRRHPWVEDAEIRRLPTGTLVVEVRERTPVALALEAGRPAFWLDGAGFRMPLATAAGRAAFDVPLVRAPGLDYHPVVPVEAGPLREVLAALGAASPETVALISEVAVRRGEVWLVTEPAGSAPARVRLGRAAFAPKLQRLATFWRQAVLTQPDRTFHLIDLRFSSQVVTEEATAGT